MEKKAAHQRGWEIAEVIFGLPLFLCIVLQAVLPVPFSFPARAGRNLRVSAGVILLVTGLVIIILARREFSAHNQPTDPGLPTHRLISSGIFRFSRNPLYLGASLVFLSIGFLFMLPWIFILFIPTLVMCSVLLIRPEERYLSEKFGESYRRYTETVHRWAGRKHR